MRFSDIKVGDVVYTPESHGLAYGWGKAAYTKTFWTARTVTKVTATQFTAGGDRFKKSGAGVGHDSSAYKAGEQYKGKLLVPSVCQSKEKQEHIKKLRVLAEFRGVELKIQNAADVDTALKAADLIRQANLLLSGGDV